MDQQQQQQHQHHQQQQQQHTNASPDDATTAQSSGDQPPTAGIDPDIRRATAGPQGAAMGEGGLKPQAGSGKQLSLMYPFTDPHTDLHTDLHTDPHTDLHTGEELAEKASRGSHASGEETVPSFFSVLDSQKVQRYRSEESPKPQFLGTKLPEEQKGTLENQKETLEQEAETLEQEAETTEEEEDRVEEDEETVEEEEDRVEEEEDTVEEEEDKLEEEGDTVEEVEETVEEDEETVEEEEDRVEEEETVEEEEDRVEEEEDTVEEEEEKLEEEGDTVEEVEETVEEDEETVEEEEDTVEEEEDTVEEEEDRVEEEDTVEEEEDTVEEEEDTVEKEEDRVEEEEDTVEEEEDTVEEEEDTVEEEEDRVEEEEDTVEEEEDRVEEEEDTVEEEEDRVEEEEDTVEEEEDKLEQEKDTVEEEEDTAEEEEDTAEEEVDTVEEEEDKLEQEKDTVEEEEDTAEEEEDTAEEEVDTVEEEEETLEGTKDTGDEEKDTVEEQGETLEEKEDTVDEEEDTSDEEEEILEEQGKTLDVKQEILKEQETQKILLKFQIILNKMAPENFRNYANHIMKLKINSEERLRGVADFLYEKAISEHHFTHVYAELSYQLNKLPKVYTDPIPESELNQGHRGKEGEQKLKEVNFQQVLLARCQREFEKNRETDQAVDEVDESNAEKEVLKEREQARRKAHHRIQGNIRLIGELFCLTMLKESAMHDCFRKLLKRIDDKNVESLITLLKVVGKYLDHPKAKEEMDYYFSRLGEVLEVVTFPPGGSTAPVREELSIRVKFLVIDILKLRQNEWVEPNRYQWQNPPWVLESVVRAATPMQRAQNYLALQRTVRDLAQADAGGWVIDYALEFEQHIELARIQIAKNESQDCLRGRWRSQQQEKRGNRSKLGADGGSSSSSSPDSSRSRDTSPATAGGVDASKTKPEDQGHRTNATAEECVSKGSCKDFKWLKGPARNMVHQEVLQRLKRNEKNERIYEWIDEKVTSEERMSPQFVRELIGAVCRHVIVCSDDHDFDVNAKETKNRMPLVRRYVDTTEKATQALFGIQHLMCELEHPQDLARTLFETCYIEDVVSEDGFFDWESRKGPPEDRVGKGMVKLTTADFFIWLRSLH